jgi:hypothetical protein
MLDSSKPDVTGAGGSCGLLVGLLFLGFVVARSTAVGVSLTEGIGLLGFETLGMSALGELVARTGLVMYAKQNTPATAVLNRSSNG